MVSQDATASRQDGLCFVVTMRVYTFIIIMIMNGRLEWNVHENTRKWWYSWVGEWCIVECALFIVVVVFWNLFLS